MSTILQINVVVNWGSTGRIVEDIGILAIDSGWKSYIAFGRYPRPSQSELIQVGNRWDFYWHILQTRLLDRHGLASKRATMKLISKIEKIHPDIIHLHNIHGYYLNYPLLIDYLININIPIVWTLHDCWAFTGHCAYFSFSHCEKWKTQCVNCIIKRSYPESLLFDHSFYNYIKKKEVFNKISNLTIVPVSNWLDKLVKESFLKSFVTKRIYNGIDLEVFKPVNNTNLIREKYGILNSHYILGIASVWDNRKGFQDFLLLRKLLPISISIVLVGLDKERIKNLPEGVIGIVRSENVKELRDLYSAASVFVNPTREDNFPTTNIEALACGTPVITYNTGGSIEAVSPDTGVIVEQGDLQQMSENILSICNNGKNYYQSACRKRAMNFFKKEERYQEYLDLYNRLLLGKKQI